MIRIVTNVLFIFLKCLDPNNLLILFVKLNKYLGKIPDKTADELKLERFLEKKTLFQRV